MAIENVTSAAITYAIRDSEIDGVEIKKDDYMALVNGKIVAATQGKIEIVKELFNKVEDIDEKEVVTIIYGKDVTDEEKEEVMAYLSETYSYLEIGELDGLQDIYSFILAIE